MHTRLTALPMGEQDVLRRLCYYDQRNPECIERDVPLPRNRECYCDNCHYGRTPLAEEILRLRSTALPNAK